MKSFLEYFVFAYSVTVMGSFAIMSGFALGGAFDIWHERYKGIVKRNLFIADYETPIPEYRHVLRTASQIQKDAE